MKRFQLDLTLRDDQVFSRRSATVGGHESLDFVPGTALWGVLANRLYRERPHEAEALVFGGGLRVGDALPIAPSGSESFPLPLCWHDDKTRPAHRGIVDSLILPDRVYNGLHAALSDMGQATTLRNGFVSHYGECVRPPRRFTLRTAIGDDGRAAEAQLYGYQSLVSGSRFRGWLEVDDDDLALPVKSLLEGAVRLGRSRGTEYGRATCSVTEVPTAPESYEVGCERISLWLLSDACLRTSSGEPTLLPDAGAIGLEGAQWVLSRCFVRHRSYTTWNRHRGCFGLERQCISAGSVLTLERPHKPFSADELKAVAGGIGVLRECGLGRVWVNAAMLAEVHPRFQYGPVALKSTVAIVASDPPRTDLVQWVQGRLVARAQDRAEGWAQGKLDELARHLAQARAFAGIGDELPLGPGRSQWGLVAAACRDSDSVADLKERLFGSAGVIKKKNNEDWTFELAPQQGDVSRPATLADWMTDLLTEVESEAEGVGFPTWPTQSRALSLLAGLALEARLHLFDGVLRHRRQTAGEVVA